MFSLLLIRRVFDKLLFLKYTRCNCQHFRKEVWVIIIIAWTAINVIWSEEGPCDSLYMPFAWKSLEGILSSCVLMLPLGGWYKLDNSLITKILYEKCILLSWQ